jgi:flagellar hook-basal body complex protein FliE
MDIGSIPSVSAAASTDLASQITSSRNAINDSGSPATGSVSGFSELVQGLLRQTNGAQLTAENAIQDFATGKNENIQQVVLAIANADMSFQFFLEIRNKVIDSYNELMRMQF